MPRYQCTLTFDTESPLTSDQLDNLNFGLTLEAEDPNDEMGDRAGWFGHNVVVDVFEVKS